MRVLFYLPVVTSWWFETIVEPILRSLTTVAEVHVLAPSPWRNTGLGPHDLRRCADLDNIGWHIVDSDDHPSLRTKPADRDGLLDYVRRLAPDIVLCRTADFATASQFPGTVRFLMEVAATPFEVAPWTTMVTDRPFANGALPQLGGPEQVRLDMLIDPLWTEMQTHWRRAIPDRGSVFGQLGIPEDRPMLLLPLEYEHEENFFLQHRVKKFSNRALLASIAREVTPRCTLVVTDHPLNALHVDRKELLKKVTSLGRHVILAETRTLGFPSTLVLSRHADGMLLGDSKSFSLAAAFGVPMLRRSRFATADWLDVETDLDRFVAAVCKGTVTAPSATDARRWFAYHLANECFDPRDATLSGGEILDRVFEPVNPARWDAGIARVRAVKPEYLQ